MAITDRTFIDKAGRVLLPRRMRELAALAPGATVEVRSQDGAIILEAAPSSVRLEKRGRFVVAVPDGDLPPLSHHTVEVIRRRLRCLRGRK